jgi:hypothetical protein
MRTPAIFYYGLAAFCIVSLFIGMAQAGDQTPAAVNTTKIHGFGYGRTPVPQLDLSCLLQQGVTMTDVKAALERYDIASIRTWRNSCRQSLKGIFENANQRQQQKFRSGTDPAGRNGLNLCPVRNLSEHSTITGMTPGSLGCNITQKPPAADSTLFRHEPLPNGTIMRHALNGSDVGQKKGAYMNGYATARNSSLYPNGRSYPGGMSGAPRFGSSNAVKPTTVGTQPTI